MHRLIGRCVYCGAYVTRRALVCFEHRDLPRLDPQYAPTYPHVSPRR